MYQSWITCVDDKGLARESYVIVSDSGGIDGTSNQTITTEKSLLFVPIKIP